MISGGFCLDGRAELIFFIGATTTAARRGPEGKRGRLRKLFLEEFQIDIYINSRLIRRCFFFSEVARSVLHRLG